MKDPLPIFTPGFTLVLIPVLTSSPKIAPNFLRPESILSPLTVTLTCLSSNLKLARLVPAPRLQLTPITESPT